MTATLFDSRKYAKRLMAAGASPAEADVYVDVMYEFITHLTAIAANTGNVSTLECTATQLETKSANAEVQQKSKIDKLGAELKLQIEHTKVELIRWTIGLGVAIIGIILALKLVH